MGLTKSSAKTLPLDRRALGDQGLALPGLPRLLGAVSGADGLLRVFFGAGALPAALAPDGAPGSARPREIRALAGGLFVTAEAGAALALADGAALPLTPAPEETGLLAGRHVILAQRFAETGAEGAQMLRYHAQHHGLEGALILDRAKGDEGFAAALAEGLAGLSLPVVLVSAAGPLGVPEAPPATHRLSAPDAPGKARLVAPPPDPWLAPLGETLVYELLKWRFLARARTVLGLDLCDLLPPRAAGEASAFDRVAASPAGLLTMMGEGIYPWRLRAGAAPGFGDHICRLFEGARPLARWGVAPEKAGLDKAWRGPRVVEAKPDPGPPLRFDRAMGLRVRGAAPAELAPKSALIEDAALLARAESLWQARPARPTPTAPAASPGTARALIVTTMKNEAPFLLEWIAYHRMIGFADFLIYTNDCSDGTDDFLALLAQRGIVQHRENPYHGTGLKPQHAALQAAEAEPLCQSADWLICMDVDEYLNIKCGAGHLSDLLAAAPGANMISATWRLFGNGDVADFDPAPVIAQFTRCAPEVIRKPHQAWGFKTLFRNLGIFRKLGVHRPKGLNPDRWGEILWVNGSGAPMPPSTYRQSWRSSARTYGYDLVQLNHYACRSAESFLVKRDRGRVNHVDRDQGLHYWLRMNHNAESEASIQRHLPGLRAALDALLADPAIAAAQAQAVAAHRAKIAELRARPDYAAFYASLISPRMRALCRLQPHFGSAVFEAGPEALPPEAEALLAKALAGEAAR